MTPPGDTEPRGRSSPSEGRQKQAEGAPPRSVEAPRPGGRLPRPWPATSRHGGLSPGAANGSVLTYRSANLGETN